MLYGYNAGVENDFQRSAEFEKPGNEREQSWYKVRREIYFGHGDNSVVSAISSWRHQIEARVKTAKEL